MRRIIKTTIIAIAFGLIFGWLLSTYNLADFFRTSGWSLLPWGVAGVCVALLGKTKRQIWLLSLVYSEVLTNSFVLTGGNIKSAQQVFELLAFGIITGAVGTIACAVIATVIRMDWPAKIKQAKK